MPVILILNGPNKDRQYPLSGGEMVGRDPANAIQVFAPGVSRVHFQFVNENGHFVVEDRNSSNGTYVNNERITRRPLIEGDVLTVGGVNMRYCVGSGAMPALGGGDGLPFSSGMVAATIPGGPGAAPTGSGAHIAAAGLDPDKSVVFQDGAEEDSLEDYALDASLIFTDSTRLDPKAGSASAVANLEKRLNLYHRISQSLAQIRDLDDLLSEIMTNLFGSFPQADRGFIMMGDRFDTLEPRCIQKRDGEAGDQVTISKTIAKRAYEQQRSILSSNAMEDSRFSGGMSILNFRILSMMCVPLIYRDEVFGIIHIDTQDRAKKFTPDDLNLLTGIAAQAATFIKNVKLIDQVQKDTEALTNMQRYFNPELAKKIISKEIDLKPGGSMREGTVFFSDIIGFTTMTEKMAPEEVVERINRYFRIMVDIIFKNKGTIDKFGGDAIMAEWNVPIPVDDEALKACEAALEMQNQLYVFNFDLKEEDKTQINMGIGLNSGSFIAGNIGSERRMEYTCIGDNVNLAQRVESKAGRGQVYAAETTFERARHGLFAINIGKTPVKGRQAEVTIYSIRGTRTADPNLHVSSLPIHAGGQDGLIVKLKKIDPASERYAALAVFFDEPSPATESATLKVQELDEYELPFTIRNLSAIPGHPGFSVQAVVDFTGTKLAVLYNDALIDSDKSLDEMSRK